jgi:hypothetical protein
MNERIKSIAENIWSLDIDPNPQFNQCLQAFAELIVNQCADIAQQHNKSPVAALFAIGYVIREHFGVEE